MADVVSAVRSYLLGKTAITDVISQRLYLDRFPQGATLPAATIAITSETFDHTLSDISGIIHTRLQIECKSTLRLTANTLATTIATCGIAAVKGLTNSVDIRGVQVEDGRRSYTVDATEGGDDHKYFTTFDLMVTYLES